MTEEERRDDLQSFWDLIPGSTDQALHSTHCACWLWAMQTDCMSTTSSLHNTDSHNGDMAAQERGGWETLSAPRAQPAKTNVGGSLASFLFTRDSLECDGAFQKRSEVRP